MSSKFLITTLILIVLATAASVFYAMDKIGPATSLDPNAGPNEPEQPQEETMITVYYPLPGEEVSSPLTVYGEARGTWYFEASFPVKLYDADGNLLATGIATALSDWMTEDFVSFSAPLTFDPPTTATGTLVLEKDNPSGLPENDDSISVPVTFSN